MPRDLASAMETMNAKASGPAQNKAFAQEPASVPLLVPLMKPKTLWVHGSVPRTVNALERDIAVSMAIVMVEVGAPTKHIKYKSTNTLAIAISRNLVV